MKTAILLGAGASIPAGFPSTQSLTDLVLSGDGVQRDSTETYVLNDRSLHTGHYVRYVTLLVQRLFADCHLARTSYVDLAAKEELELHRRTKLEDRWQSEKEKAALDSLEPFAKIG